MWNIIRKTKNVMNTTTAITINKFDHYYREKFDAPKETTRVMEESKTKVQEKLEHALMLCTQIIPLQSIKLESISKDLKME